jgi:hypothetical protein
VHLEGKGGRGTGRGRENHDSWDVEHARDRAVIELKST